MSTSVKSPGGTAQLRSFSAARKGYIGTIAAGLGALLIYGSFQGAQAAMYCEATIPTSASGAVAYSCLNPLKEGQSGAILYGDESLINIAEVPIQVTRINICTSTGASQPCHQASGDSNIMSGVLMDTKDQLLTMAQTGALASTPTAYVVLAPRDQSGGRRFLNVTFYDGSGSTTTTNPPAYLRFQIVPCKVGGIGC